jgi:hypothetical protein
MAWQRGQADENPTPIELIENDDSAHKRNVFAS